MNIPAPVKEIEFTAVSLPQRNYKPEMASLMNLSNICEKVITQFLHTLFQKTQEKAISNSLYKVSIVPW